MEMEEAQHRTRSRAAPDWTAEESLILVNEINAIESEWGATLPSFQKWKQIVENCNALDVARNLNQCKRKWDALLTEYRRRRQPDDDASLPLELFQAIHSCVNAKGNNKTTTITEDQLVMDTDPDSDPEAQAPVTDLLPETTGLKKQRPRMKRNKRRLESLNPWGYFTSPKTKQEESNIMKPLPEGESNEDVKRQAMATMLYENALRINFILESNPAADDDDDDGVDYKLTDLKNAEALQTDFTRRQGDELIECLGKISATLNQLCDLVQQCK